MVLTLVFSSQITYSKTVPEITYKEVKKPVATKSGNWCGTMTSEELERSKEEDNKFNNECKPLNYYCLSGGKGYCEGVVYPTIESVFCKSRPGNLPRCAGEAGEEIKLFSSEQDCQKFNFREIEATRKCATVEYNEQLKKLRDKCVPITQYCYSAYSPEGCEVVEVSKDNSDECKGISNYYVCFMGKDSKLFSSKEDCILSNDKDKPTVNYATLQFIRSLFVDDSANPAIDLICQQTCGKTYDSFKTRKDGKGDNIITCLDDDPITPKTIVNNGDASWNTNDKVRMGCMYVEGKKNPDIIYKMYEVLSDSYNEEGKNLKDKGTLLDLAESIDIDFKENTEKDHKMLNIEDSSWCIKENLIYNSMNLGKYFKCAGRLK